MKLNEVITNIRLRYATEIPSYRAFKPRQLARQNIEGNFSKQYSLLWSYGVELRKVSSGNTFKLNINCLVQRMQLIFERCYIYFDGTKKTLRKACRPFISLYGCHLMHNYGGILLIIVERDPNDQYLPFAFGVVENETKES